MAKKDSARSRSRSERFESEATMTAADVAGYLEGLAQGLRAGTVVLGEEGESFTAPVAGDVELEVEARHGKRKSRIELTLAFRLPPSVDESPQEDEASAGGSIPDEMSF